MRQKQIQVGNKKLLALDMPEEYPTVQIASYPRSGTFIMESGAMTLNAWKHFLGKGEYKIIGFKNDITEEQWEEIVEPSFGILYKDHTNEKYAFPTAKESGLSLLQANNIDYLNCLIIQVI